MGGLYRLHRYGDTEVRVSRIAEVMDTSIRLLKGYEQLRHWELANAVEGHPRLWEITPEGIQYVEGSFQVSKVLLIYNGRRYKKGQDEVTFIELMEKIGEGLSWLPDVSTD